MRAQYLACVRVRPRASACVRYSAFSRQWKPLLLTDQLIVLRKNTCMPTQVCATDLFSCMYVRLLSDTAFVAVQSVAAISILCTLHHLLTSFTYLLTYLLTYSLMVEMVAVYVHNAGYPAFYDTTTLNVVVLDANDNPPVFSKTTNPLTLNIPENANMAVVHTVEAYDADAGDNGHVSYYISGKKRCLYVFYLTCSFQGSIYYFNALNVYTSSSSSSLLSSSV